MSQDFRFALRLLRRAPGPTLVSIVTMSLGIGASTILFSVAWGVLFKPLPWPDADRLVRLTETREGSTRRFQRLTNGTYLAWKDAPSTIEGIAGYTAQPATLTGSGDPQRVRVAEVTASLFPLLGARAAIGSVFTDEVANADSIVLSYALWQQQYGGSHDVLGRVVRIDGEARTILGVMPRAFAFPDTGTQAWVPMNVPPVVVPNSQGRRISIFYAMARLKPGVTAAQAASEATARGRAAPDPGLVTMAIFGTRGPLQVTATPMLQAMTAEVHTPLLVFLVAVGLLLATATANVASVQLARSAARRREMAIRAAIGAGSGRLARQLLVENLLLGSIAGVAGVLSALAFQRALPSLLPPDFPRAAGITIDLPVLAFAIAVSMIVSLAFGALPALYARRVNLVQSLMEDGQAPVGGSSRSATARLRMLIMAGQVAVACVLLVGASLLVQSFEKLIDADRGYDVANVLTAHVPLPNGAYTPARRSEIVKAVLGRMAQVPRVTHVASTDILPLGASDALMAFTMPSPGGGEPTEVHASVRTVSTAYFAAMGIRLVDGRAFADTDTQTSLPVLIVNRTFAQRYIGASPVGRRLPVAFEEGKHDWEVVGVADDIRMGSMTDPVQPEIFIPLTQLRGLRSSEPIVVIRTAGDPVSFIPALRAAARAEDPGIALDNVSTMEQRLTGNLARPRLYAVLIGAFAAFALIIAAVGLFGVLSYSVSQRSREIAVRGALGARPSDIVRLVVGQGLTVTVAGLIAGLAASVVLTGAIRSFLFGVQVHDTRTFVVVPLILLVVAAVACFIPARRAARLDPLKVLKAG
ncbi:MAG: hypothetical protein A3H96_06640 [Acidobacteria bacterium RIFCSPLOWO2_02_FULL_67_36]|nr:MAG: hypothetical protein A3H96_06640 [Acidobacteria bacterium RIFCSPLOWO2_02_FULL_67_36]OFW23589.1 MAG: hypothetical protein A3G21_06585 [Acidobacteria bacterium RIFCSPLOWO2_12_FULL_66_21]